MSAADSRSERHEQHAALEADGPGEPAYKVLVASALRRHAVCVRRECNLQYV